MTEGNSSIFHLAIFLVLILKLRAQFPDGNEVFSNRSKANYTDVPKDISLKTTILDASQNCFSQLQASDFSSLSKLRILILSHNKIQSLDTSIFKFNLELEYLDLSHNQLWMISCNPTVNFRHLDLSFNDFDVLPICNEFGNMSELSFLGLSATRLQKSPVQLIAHLNISKVLLVLGELYGQHEDSESLQDLNTKSLHIVFPPHKAFHFVLDVAASSAVNLELSNIKCVQNEDEQYFFSVLLKLQRNPRLLNLTINNINTTWNSFIRILQLVWHTSIEYFSITNVELKGQVDQREFHYSDTSLKALSVHQVVSHAFYLQQDYIYSIFSNMNIQSLRVTGTRMVHVVCPLRVSPFVYLNFSNNLLTDATFENCGTLTKLEILILELNQLKELAKIVHMTKDMKSLRKLDISRNSLGYETGINCSWTKSLLILNMSSNILTDSVFRCLPPKVTVLDLHNNRIKSIPKDATSLDALEELNVAFNSLTDLPGCGRLSSLSVLIITNNAISQPSAKFFSSCQRMRSVKAGNNPFQCSCELRDFIKGISHMSSDVVEDWPESYKCDYPESYKETALQDFHMSELACNTTLLIVTIGISMLVLAALVTFVCVCFDLPWYLRMVCQWTQTRYRARNIPLEELQRNVQFHAFISYSGHDSAWVKNELLPNLEREGLRICLHERDFVAGKSIVENIINCTEQSYKSIFVLSPNFVQSEWCHYELYFAHHKLFHEGSHNLILILLESIPQYTIPSNYHKLKTLMARKTYLEWPKEKSKHGLFWANLRAAISIKLTEQKKEIV
ncbi:toll-like receptor 1 [Echinops telfairi]|uniref:Toll-like receptor 1 n=1 Tax=Echinops telfairi TaxID=9371 RepID=A0ABM0IME7_ECHTE|nr:toll-like receptor 1 [Echinops telfairi]